MKRFAESNTDLEVEIAALRDRTIIAKTTIVHIRVPESEIWNNFRKEWYEPIVPLYKMFSSVRFIIQAREPIQDEAGDILTTAKKIF